MANEYFIRCSRASPLNFKNLLILWKEIEIKKFEESVIRFCIEGIMRDVRGVLNINCLKDKIIAPLKFISLLGDS